MKEAFLKLAERTGILRRWDWYLTKINYHRRISINGVQIKSLSIAGVGCKVSETWLVDLLARILEEKKGAFLDVGVNVGQTLIKVKALDPERPYIGFEPNPVCVFYVNELIKHNRMRNCTICPVGLSAEDAILHLNFFTDNPTDGSASLVENFRPNVYSRALVPVFRFESVEGLLDIGDVGVVKIDVEGAELDVIKSLLGVIRHDRPIIFLEVLPVYSDDNVSRKSKQEEMERIFFEASYRIYRVQKTAENGYGGLEQLETIGIHSNLNQCDYMIVPDEDSARMQTLAEVSAKSVHGRRRE